MLDSHPHVASDCYIVWHRTSSSRHFVPWVSGKGGQESMGEVVWKSHIDGRVKKLREWK